MCLQVIVVSYTQLVCIVMLAVGLLLLLAQLWPCILSISPLQNVICVFEDNSKQNQLDLSYRHNCTSFPSNLSVAAQEVIDGTVLLFLNKEETIESLIEFINVSGLTLLGTNDTNIVCNQTTVKHGLEFINVTDLKISGMSIINCGLLYHYKANEIIKDLTSYNASTAVYFENCTNIDIRHITVRKSHGAGLTLYDCNGHVSITHSYFLNNIISKVDEELANETGNLVGGGGIYYELTRCSPSWEICDPNTNVYNTHSSFYVYNCTFSYNAVKAGLNNFDYAKYLSGGIMVYLSGVAKNNTVLIENSYFNDNKGLYGGGMFVLCKDESKNNNVTLRNLIFINNTAILGAGGANIGFYFNSVLKRSNSIFVQSCTFTGNRAYFGGGVALFFTSASQIDPDNYIELRDTVWQLNEGTYGSAMSFEPLFNSDEPANAIFPVPHIINCSFINNYIMLIATGGSSGSGVGIATVGAGAMNIKAISFKLSGLITFSGNNGTALYLVDSNAIVLENTTVIFSNNTGMYGGAVSINGFASIFANPKTSFYFHDNVASVKGGAIFCHSTDFQTSLLITSACFVERAQSSNSSTINFYFKNNTDPFRKSMYVSTLLPCNKLCQTTHVYITYYAPEELLKDCIANFTFADYNGSVKENLATETSEFNLIEVKAEKEVVPGKDFLIPFVTRDELGHQSMEPLFGILRTKHDSLRLENIYTANNKFQIRGQTNDTGHLEIGTLYYRNLTVGMSIKVTACPPGFVNNNDTCICSADHDSDHYYGITRCDNKEFVATLTSGLWVGYAGIVSEGTLYTGLCPQGYCNNSQILDVKLPSVPSFNELDSLVCGSKNRTGILCGDCIENNSVYYNAPGYKCGNNDQCSYGPLYYLLSSIIPLTLMFTVIIMLGVNFSSGRWNGFVFFAQIVGYFTTTTNGVLYVSSSERVFHVISVLFYGPFSLRFFNDDHFSFCIIKNASFFAIMGMEIFSLFFALLLVVILVFVMKSNYFYRMQSACCKRPFFKPTTLTKALTTFLILCYSQTTQICFKLLQIGFLRGKGGKTIYPLRVQQMGSQEYFTGTHIPFVLAALIGILTIVTITPLCLMAYPVFYKALPQRIQEKKLMAALLMKVEKLKPIFDTFQSCFHDKYRFFAGLYFLYRVIFVSVFSLINVPLASLSIAQVVVMIMLTVHLKFQPYKNKLYNNIDGFLFLLLGVINILTLARYVESLSQSQESVLIATGYVQLFFVYFAIVLFFVLVFGLIRKIFQRKRQDLNRKTFLSSLKSDRTLSSQSVISYDMSRKSSTSTTISFFDMDINSNDTNKDANTDGDDDAKLRNELEVLEL